MDAAGNLYGTTQYGGKGNGGNGGGVVFQLTPNHAHTAWTQTVLYALCAGDGTCPDGIAPNASLIADASGNLYGTTLGGGNVNQGGVVFELTPNPAHTAWTESVLYAFCPAGGICPMATALMTAWSWMPWVTSMARRYMEATPTITTTSATA
jgi:hypothetical protein